MGFTTWAYTLSCARARVGRTPTLNRCNQLLAPPTLAPYSLYSTSLRGLRPNYHPPPPPPEEKFLPFLSPQVSADRSLLRYLLALLLLSFLPRGPNQRSARKYFKGRLNAPTPPLPPRVSLVACINNRVDA